MGMLTQIVIAALVTAFMAQVVSEDEITRPIREWIRGRVWPPLPEVGIDPMYEATIREIRPRWLWKFLAGVVGCYRCSGVWLSILATFMVQARWPWTGGWNGMREFVVVMFAASAAQFALWTLVLRARNEPEMLKEVAEIGVEAGEVER